MTKVKLTGYWKRVDDKIVRHVKPARKKHRVYPSPYVEGRKARQEAAERTAAREAIPTPAGHVRTGWDKDGPVFAKIVPTEQPTAEEISAAVKRTERALVKRGACAKCFYLPPCRCGGNHVEVKPKGKAVKKHG